MKNTTLKYFIIFITIHLNITGCSSIPTEDVKPVGLSNQQALNLENLDSHIKEWNKISPSLHRLVAIESELKDLILELNTLIDIEPESKKPTSRAQVTPPIIKPATATEPATAIVPATESATVPSTVPATAIVPSTVPSTVPSIMNDKPLMEEHRAKLYSIQLFSVTDKKVLKSKWKELSSKHARIFNNFTAFYQEKNINGVRYYRLKIGAFANKKNALKKCDEMNTVNIKCYITDGVGTQL
jgi:hypothetical protein